METIRISLAAARVNANMTQETVANAMKVSVNTIINWEKYKTSPSIQQGMKLCELYGLPSDMIDMCGTK